MSNEDIAVNALPMSYWAYIWSPLVESEDKEAPWQALQLPGCFADIATEYWSSFHIGSPQPVAPLLLSAMLNKDASAAREDWLRVMNHLGLEWNDVHLPPDQLGVACEAFAVAIAQQEAVLVDELRDRYLRPWCMAAREVLEDEHLRNMVVAFQQAVEAASV